MGVGLPTRAPDRLPYSPHAAHVGVHHKTTQNHGQQFIIQDDPRSEVANPVSGDLAMFLYLERSGIGGHCQQLLLPHSLRATIAAIALAAITTHTDSKGRVARGINAPPQAKALNGSICCHGAGHSHAPGMIGQTTAPSAR